MNDTPQRRSLLEGLNSGPKSAPPPLPEASIAQAAARHGFADPAPTPPVPGPAPAGTITLRRQRKAMGRTEQFNVRLMPETLEAIYAEANARDIPLAQVIEEAIAALRSR